MTIIPTVCFFIRSINFYCSCGHLSLSLCVCLPVCVCLMQFLHTIRIVSINRDTMKLDAFIKCKLEQLHMIYDDFAIAHLQQQSRQIWPNRLYYDSMHMLSIDSMIFETHNIQSITALFFFSSIIFLAPLRSHFNSITCESNSMRYVSSISHFLKSTHFVFLAFVLFPFFACVFRLLNGLALSDYRLFLFRCDQMHYYSSQTQFLSLWLYLISHMVRLNLSNLSEFSNE